MVILKTAGRNVSIWKKGVSEEEAKREMLALYNFLFQGERNSAPNWGVALRRSMNEIDGASGLGDERKVQIGNVEFEMFKESDANDILEDSKRYRYWL